LPRAPGEPHPAVLEGCLHDQRIGACAPPRAVRGGRRRSGWLAGRCRRGFRGDRGGGSRHAREPGHGLRHRRNHEYPGHPRRPGDGRRAEDRAGSAGRQDPGGRLVVSHDRRRTGITDGVVVRLNANGTLDSSFGTGGTTLTSVSLDGGGFSALFPQLDGTVIAVGEGTVSSTQSELVIARFNL
jgi:Domain of unknown function (DUF5122) beta-propeller